MMTKNRARIQNLVLVNWKGFFYQPFEMDGGVTALEGENGAGKTTVMIAAFVALLPDQRLLQFRNVSEGGSVEGDRGIFGRLGERGTAYTVLDVLSPRGGRILAGVMLRRKAPPSLELTPFLIEGLPRDLPLEDILLTRDEQTESVPELSDLRQKVGVWGGALKACESVAQYTSQLFDLGVIPLRMEAYAEREKFNRMLQTSMYGGLSSSIQKGLRDYLLTEDPSLRNHVARMRENLEACRVTRREIGSAEQKYKTIQGVFQSGYGMFEAAFHGTRLRVAGLARNVEASRSDHMRCREELTGARRRKDDLGRKHAEARTELDGRQKEHQVAEELWGRCKRAREIALEIERLVPLRRAAKQERERIEGRLRSAEERFREYEWNRDRLLAEKEENAAGMADAQKAWEQVSRKVALYKQAKESMNDAREALPDREVTERSVPDLLSECRDRWNMALESKTRIEAELGSLEIRARRHAEILEVLCRASRKDVTTEHALETARELDRELREATRRLEAAETLPARMEEARSLDMRQREVRRKVAILEGRGEMVENGAALRSLFESRQKEQDILAEELRALQERLAALGEERARTEQQLERLQAEAVEWREACGLLKKLEDAFEASIGDGPALEGLRVRIQGQLAAESERLRQLEEERETVRKTALDLEFGGGRLDESLVRLRDLADAKLVAELYDEVPEKDAATVEARLGPLHGALLVGEMTEAVQRILQEPDRPDDVWLMEPAALKDLPEGKSYPEAELVNMGAAWRLTRHPDRPVVGRMAREREIGRLRGRVDELRKEIETVRSLMSRFQEGMKTIDVLSRYWRFLGVEDPGELAGRLRNRLNDIKGEERRARRRREELALRITDCRDVLDVFTQCLPDAGLMDDPDWAETLQALQREYKEEVALESRMKVLEPTMERVREDWFVLEHPPPGPDRIEARREALVRAEEVLNYWSKGRDLLGTLMDRLPHLGYSEQERLMVEQESALEALKRQMGKVDRELGAAREEVEKAGKDLDGERQGFNRADASFQVLREKAETLERDLAATGEDGSSRGLDAAQRSREEAKNKLDAARETERGVYGNLIGAGKDVEIAENRTTAARERRRTDLEALWPHWRNWMSLKRRATREGLADRLMTPEVVRSYDQKSPPRAFEESFRHQGELKRILLGVPGGEDLWREVERPGEANGTETRRGSQTLDAWLVIRGFLEKSIPRDIAHADDPETALQQIEEHLNRLNGRLMDQERQLRQHSDTIANSIRTRIRREERQIHRINKGLEAIRFGTIGSIRIRLERVEAMQRLLDGLKMQKDLFSSGMSLEEAMVELYRQVGGGQVRGDQLLDYREYVRMSVEVRRLASDKWSKATSSVLSTGESIGVGAAVLMVILDAWEHQAELLRGRRDGGSLRFLFLDEAARLSPRSLDTLGELCERMDMQLLVAAPAADRARRGTAYRLVRRIGEDGGEEVIVRGRRFTGQVTLA